MPFRSTDDAYKRFCRVAQRGNILDHFSCSKLINNLCRDENIKRDSTVFNMLIEMVRANRSRD